MGSTFSDFLTSGFRLYLHPEVTPSPLEEPTFDPNLGFENGRKERVMIASEEEMRSGKVPLKERGYCAHLLLQYRACCKDNWPWPVKCTHEQHAFLHCKYDDFVIRMKEYEREKRLRVREQRIKQLEGSA